MRTFTTPEVEDEKGKLRAKDVIIIVLLVFACGMSAVNFAILVKSGVLSDALVGATESVSPTYSEHTTIVFANSTTATETYLDRSIPLEGEVTAAAQTDPGLVIVSEAPTTEAFTVAATEPSPPTTVFIVPPATTEAPAVPATSAPAPVVTAPPATETQFPININTATAEQLMLLNGIGEKKAQAIIEYRDNNGPFERIDDILKVSGIGDKTFANIRDFITV